MKEMVKTCTALLAAIAVVFLAACPQAPELSSSASVASVTVAGKTVALGTPSKDWVEAKEVENAGEVFLTVAQMANARVVVNKGQSGQTVYIAAAKPAVMPEFAAGETTFTFEALDYLWVEVFSENHDDYKLYAIQVMTSTPTILDVTVGGRSAVGGVFANGEPFQQYGTGLGISNSDVAQITASQEGEIWYGSSEEGTILPISATPEDPDTTFFMATGAANATADSLFPANYTNPAGITVTDGGYLFIKSISADAENGETIFHKIKLVAKNDDFSLDDITIQAQGGTAVSFLTGSMGTRGFGGADNHSGGAELHPALGARYILPSVPASPVSVTVDIGTIPEGAKVRYGRTDFVRAQEGIPFGDYKTLVYQESGPLNDIESFDYIAVEITTELGDKGWYAFQVAMGANSEITAMHINGVEVILADAKNPAISGPVPSTGGQLPATAGTNSYKYRPESIPADTNSNGFWDDIELTFSGYDLDVSQVRIATAMALDQFSGVAEGDWITVTANGSAAYSFDDTIGTGNFIVINVKNPDLEYYYKIQLAYGSSDYKMTALTINGAPATIGTPSLFDYIRNRRGGMWDGTRGNFTLSQYPLELVFNATVSPGATYRYGFLMPGRDFSVTPPEFSTTSARNRSLWVTPPNALSSETYNTQITPAMQVYQPITDTILKNEGYPVIIQVTSEDKTNFTYYVVQVKLVN